MPTALPSPIVRFGGGSMRREVGGRQLNYSGLRSAYQNTLTMERARMAAEQRLRVRLDALGREHLAVLLSDNPEICRTEPSRHAIGEAPGDFTMAGIAAVTCAAFRLVVDVGLALALQHRVGYGHGLHIRADGAIAAEDRERGTASSRHGQHPPTAAESTVPADGALAPEAAAALGLVSRATLYRLLKILPAPIMLGTKKQRARWPSRASFEAWLAAASRKRREAATLPLVIGPAKRRGRRAIENPESSHDPLDDLRRRLLGKQR